MDLSTIIILIIVFIMLFSMCGWCCKRKSDVITFTTVTVPQPVNVPHAVHANQNYGAYPTAHSQNMAQRTVMPGLNQPLPNTPYPMPQPVHPAPIGFQGVSFPVNNPYPAPTMVTHQQPPSYDDAVASAPYHVQPPYNPNFK